MTQKVLPSMQSTIREIESVQMRFVRLFYYKHRCVAIFSVQLKNEPPKDPKRNLQNRVGLEGSVKGSIRSKAVEGS